MAAVLVAGCNNVEQAVFFMLTQAITFVQDVQLICFAVIFALMALQDRENLSLRWVAFGYLSGLIGGVLDFTSHYLPDWLGVGIPMEQVPVGFACFYVGLTHFVNRGAKSRWLVAGLVAVTLPFHVEWSRSHSLTPSLALLSLTLAVQTSITVWLLLTTSESVTRWPRRAMGAFLALFSVVECVRFAVFALTGQMPDRVAPSVEIASGIVFVVACSVFPLALIWMMNSRLHNSLNLKSISDPLTQLLNRRGLQEAGEVEIARYRRFGHDFALVVADIDHFKQFNDAFGHAGGDLVLIGTASLFKRMLRQNDILGRLGGEEFVLVLPETDLEGAQQLIERLRGGLETHSFTIGGKDIRATSSFGITGSRGRRVLQWETLLREADLALYEAKRAGRNLSQVYEQGDSFEQADDIKLTTGYA